VDGHDRHAGGELPGGAPKLGWLDDAGSAARLAVHGGILVRLDGFLVVDKPTGWTSHDVVAKLRKAAPRGTKIGHAGTLDPMATGVLVVAFGAATRLVEWATADDKRYLAEVTLGLETDTYDADGAVVRERPVEVNREQVEGALATLRGAIQQAPPAYSAIKVEGQRSYDRARRGQVVAPEPRAVHVHRLDLLRFDPPRLELDVTCSKGTNVRSLAWRTTSASASAAGPTSAASGAPPAGNSGWRRRRAWTRRSRRSRPGTARACCCHSSALSRHCRP
jgi:tRNA pseudouridine(55) synthase